MLLSMTRLFISALMLMSFSIFASSELYQAQDWVLDDTFTQGIEGPAVDKRGMLYVVNFAKQGTIGRIRAKNNVELFIQLPEKSVGNGIRFDQQGNMYIADYVNHNILLIDHYAQNQALVEPRHIQVYAHSPVMHQPNDLAIMDNGILFASDPNWAKNTGQLWRVNGKRELDLLEQDMGTTNGIEVSPDNKILYVNESVQRNIWRYDINDRGKVSNKRLLIQFADFGLDGMRTDQAGNLLVARYGKGVIAIISPEGKLIREVNLKGKYPTNLAFGGIDGKQVFVTMQKRGAIEMFTHEWPGRSFKH